VIPLGYRLAQHLEEYDLCRPEFVSSLSAAERAYSMAGLSAAASFISLSRAPDIALKVGFAGSRGLDRRPWSSLGISLERALTVRPIHSLSCRSKTKWRSIA